MFKRKRWKIVLAAVLAVCAGDFAMSRVLHTGRMRRYFTARFESAFGRPVQVANFDLRLFPSPRLEAAGVTVEEDPGFGSEYFLRAERVTAGLHWSAFLSGRLEFGTFSFTRPSLNLVRGGDGRWNLERWLPPARRNGAAMVGPAPLPAPGVRLDRVEFDEGRINFMSGTEKLSFAFTGVTGSVEQIAAGRWMLQLEAEPWRSGVALQAAGTLQVRGDIAGTSARLQPAEIHLHWSEASLADLLRLARGEDYGLRGQIAVDATARSAPPGSGNAPAGEWSFNLQARGQGIHRWDLTERQDNPSVNLLCDGHWNVSENRLRVEQAVVEGPSSNARGEAEMWLGAKPAFELRVNSAVVQAADLLAWYRAFQPGVAEGVAGDGYVTGAAALHGWPLEWRNLAVSSSGGTLTVPALGHPIRIGPIEGGRTRDRITLEPVRIAVGAAGAEQGTGPRAKNLNARGPKRAQAVEANTILVSASQELRTQSGFFAIEGSVDHAQEVLSLAAALGRPFERGWELQGSAAAVLRWEWGAAQENGRSILNGHIDFSKGRLQVAGLNQPLQLGAAQLLWEDGKRRAHLGALGGFGGEWSGDVMEGHAPSPGGAAEWKFQLHADQVDAAELDRWVGPRARPGWLERLLATFGSSSAPLVSASELIRRIRATGELQVDELRVEKFVLKEVHASAALNNLRIVVTDATAQWAGGTVSGTVTADFAARPRYRIDAKAERVRLEEFPGAERGRLARFDGTATVEIRLTAEGVGREELLRTLGGVGRVELRNGELRGWDLAASLADGTPRAGSSRWNAGDGMFGVRDRTIVIEPLRLDSAKGSAVVRGTVSFGRAVELSFISAVKNKAGTAPSAPASHAQISGPLDALRLSVVKEIAPAPAAAIRRVR